MADDKIIPLFPLGVVLLPEMRLPLHIFEERYKLMVGECLERKNEFGIVYFSGNEMKKVGCTAQIIEVLHRYENGEMDIMTLGKNRFFIKQIHDKKTYLEGSIVYFDDEPEEVNTKLTELAAKGMKFLRESEESGGIARDVNESGPSDPKIISFLISANDGFTPDEKQRLLEMTSTRKRLADSIRALQKVVLRDRLTREIAGIIKGNGDVAKISEQYAGVKE
jgi:Lon protease-like protein